MAANRFLVHRCKYHIYPACFTESLVPNYFVASHRLSSSIEHRLTKAYLSKDSVAKLPVQGLCLRQRGYQHDSTLSHRCGLCVFGNGLTMPETWMVSPRFRDAGHFARRQLDSQSRLLDPYLARYFSCPDGNRDTIRYTIYLDFIYQIDNIHRPDIWVAYATECLRNGCQNCLPWNAD